jgi:His-Xaa-Ser system protein HxsD
VSGEAASNGGCFLQRDDARTLTAIVDQRIYSRKALLRTCYWYTDKLYVYIEVLDPNRYAVRFRQCENVAVDLTALAGQFLNDLLENELRTQIATETAPVREMLVAKALGYTPNP